MQDQCPLCHLRPVKEKLKLYETPVCKKCYYGFANRRQFAYLIDMIILQLLSIFVGFAAGLVLAAVIEELSEAQARVASIFFMLMGFGVGVAYGIKDGFGGKSIGKFICRVTCMNEDTYQTAGFGASFLRNLLLNIPLFPFVVLCMMNKGHRPGDGFARTRVIWDKYRDNPVFNPLPVGSATAISGFSDSERMPMPVDSNNPYQPPVT